ncbi:portal protein [Pannonibacter tanglangensis]|uniref:Bacteriophage head to tail connecting protein n=1 Tax=Pannonibacter tanglangensis TaxID=2750084 RepID=A0ABW9ZGA6_9HYPH|nr:portal protein [Pannonibacter sp. XCT-34]NBN62057.1 hypothetical protein [Pannonibacter sp. XCT-34]
MTNVLAGELIEEKRRLETARSNFAQQWQEVAERVLPSASRTFHTPPGLVPPGEKKTEKQLDSRAAIALTRYTAVVASLLTPQNQKWHTLSATDTRLDRDPQVRRWFDEVRAILFARRRMYRSGFYRAAMKTYQSQGAFGTGAVFVDLVKPTPQDPEGGLRYTPLALGNTYLRESGSGAVDTCVTEFALENRQVERYIQLGYFDRAPKDHDKVMASPHRRADKRRYLRFIAPNGEYDGGRMDWRGRPWAAHYVCIDTEEVLGVDGHHTFPVAVCRDAALSGDVYGTGPAMSVLPNIKVLNEQKRTHLKIGHRLADPVLLTHDDGVLDTFSLRPGAINQGGLTDDGRKLVQRLDDNVGQLSELGDMMDKEAAVIEDAFLVTLFQILTETPRMTATEVLERMREKSILLSPTMAPLQDEFLGVTIERELDLLTRAGQLPPMPRALIEAQGEYQVRYENPLARAMEAEDAAGFARWTEQALTIANVTQDPSSLDWINTDVAMPALAAINSVPAAWVATPDEVGEKRRGREQRATIQQAIEAAPGVAGLLKAGAGNG